MNKEVKKFYKHTKNLFYLFNKKDRTFLKHFKQTLLEETTDKTTYDDCIELYGLPKNILLDYYNDVDEDTFLKNMRSQSRKKKIMIAFMSILLFASCLTSYYIYNHYKKIVDSAPDEIRITLEEV